QAIEYFQNNAERMHDPDYRARGLEIGSGIIESSGRRLVAVRCKQPGMRWTDGGLRSIITLRTHALNDSYDRTLPDLLIVASLPTLVSSAANTPSLLLLHQS